MQSRPYAVQPCTHMSVEMTWGAAKGRRIREPIRIAVLNTAGYQHDRYHILITCSRAKFKSRVSKGQSRYRYHAAIKYIVEKTIADGGCLRSYV
eukprot:SAG31_NODE_63_length_28659_cov_23.074685_11_plen_94_part_00